MGYKKSLKAGLVNSLTSEGQSFNLFSFFFVIFLNLFCYLNPNHLIKPLVYALNCESKIGIFIHEKQLLTHKICLKNK